jgi:predicted nucleotidyltransferase
MIDAGRSHRITHLRAAIEQFHPQPAFSCLFGSTARGDAGPLSDIDVGVFFAREVPLTVLARLSEDLEEAAGCSVDLVELSGLWERKPTLSYRIACEMQVLTAEDRDALVHFRKRSFLEYIDTEPLRRRMKDSLRRRLAAGRAGQRNYVG